MNLNGLTISNILVVLGVLALLIAGVIEWYYGVLIIIYVSEIKLNE